MPSISIGLPQLVADGAPAIIGRFAQEAETLGFDGLWTIDNAAGGPTADRPVLDPLGALAYAAARTEQIALGTAVLVLPRRHPVQVAKELASLDLMSGERIVVGVGIGADDGTVADLGYPTDRPYGRLFEGVEVMRSIWRENPPVHFGKIWEFSGIAVEPKPARGDDIPVWFGAAGPKTLSRVAQAGNGWVGAGASSTEDFREQVEILRQALAEQGRAPDEFTIAKRIYIAVEDERSSAEREVEAGLERLYGTMGLGEKVGVSGDIDDCVEQLESLVEQGAENLILTPVHDQLNQLTAYAAIKERLAR